LARNSWKSGVNSVRLLESIPTTCPHDLFRRDDDPKARASQATPAWADVSRIIVNRKENAATQAAALIIPAVGNNKLRHETLQRFMLCNDSVTAAIEVPIWLREHDIGALEWQLGVEIAPRSTDTPRVITGHLDFLQVRNGAVHILDYKPDAGTNNHDLRVGAHAPRHGTEVIRHQVRVVQRTGVLRILPEDAVHPPLKMDPPQS
jgi:hypothetical protein